MSDGSLFKHFDLKPWEMKDDIVPDKTIRRYIASMISDEYWKPQDTDNIIINDNGTWESPGTFGATRGHWYVDGGLEILIGGDD